MKTDKELIEILIDVLYLRFYPGMCVCISSLCEEDFISPKDEKRLYQLIKYIKPEEIHTSGFYWHWRDYGIRIQKLQELQFDINGKLLTYENR